MSHDEDPRKLRESYITAAKMALGLHLARLRNEVGITQEGLVNVKMRDRSNYLRTEKGKGSPTLVTLKDFADGLDIDLSDVVDFEWPLEHGQERTTPRYLQLAHTLRAKIESHELPPGTKLPVPLLSKEYRKTRMAVEKALLVLRADGYVSVEGDDLYVRELMPN